MTFDLLYVILFLSLSYSLLPGQMFVLLIWPKLCCCTPVTCIHYIRAESRPLLPLTALAKLVAYTRQILISAEYKYVRK